MIEIAKMTKIWVRWDFVSILGIERLQLRLIFNMLFPLKSCVVKRWSGFQIKSDFKIKVPVLNALGAYISPKIYNEISKKTCLKEYILEQTKKSVDSGDLDLQGVEAKCLELNSGFPYVIFGEVKQNA